METLTEEYVETTTGKTMETIEETFNCHMCDFSCNSETPLLVHMKNHKANRVF